MAPQRHRYTKCILFTGQRANKSNERVVCKYCSEAESPQWALQNALLCNTKKLVKSHLRRCRFFHAAQASGKDEPIVFTEDEGDDGSGDDRPRKSANANKRKSLVFVGANESTAHGGAATAKNDKRMKMDDKLQASGAASALAKLTRGGGSANANNALVSVGEQDALERLLLNATLANGWSFAWVDQRASTQLLQFLQPYVRLPDSDALAGRILQAAGEKEAEQVWSAVEKERIGCTVVLDAWKQVLKERALGVMLTTSQGEMLVWESKRVHEMLPLRGKGDNALPKVLTAELAALETSSVNVIAIVSDSSAGYAHARQTLRLARRDLMVLPCVAHQLNAFVADVFTLVPLFQETLRHAVDLAVAMQCCVAMQKKFKEKQLEMGQPHAALPTLPAIRLEWDSLRNLTVKLVEAKDVVTAVLNAEESTSEIQRKLSHTLRSGASFWQPLVDVDRILFHVARWIAIIKLHQGRLHYVPIVKHSIASTLQQQLTMDIGSPLIERLEARWDEWEHPLVVLSVALNPAFGWRFIDSSSGVTLMRLTCWARYYFESFFGSQPHNLANELVEYVEGDKFWCSPASIGSFATPVYPPTTTGDAAVDDAELLARLSFKVVQYWKSCSTDCPELSKLALRIFAVAVTSASTDGLFTAPPVIDGLDELPARGEYAQLAAIRVRARTQYEQRHDATPERPPRLSNSEDGESASSSATGGSSDSATRRFDKLQVSEQGKLSELLQRWDDQVVQTDGDKGDAKRETANENEAINSMYAKIHPADDKFSKYSIQKLFLSST